MKEKPSKKCIMPIHFFDFVNDQNQATKKNLKNFLDRKRRQIKGYKKFKILK